MAQKLSHRLGVPVYVENRAGMGGGMGIGLLSKAAADGYTFAFSATSPLSLSPHLLPTSYDPFRDIAPVISVMQTPILLVGTPAFKGTRFQDLFTLGQGENPLRWATSGHATTGYLVMESVRRASKLDIVHIPYKGGGQQLMEALNGQFELLSTNMGETQLQYIRQGRLKPLAVGAPARLKQLPDVPTFAELGIAQANLTSSFGIFAPAKTPATILARLNAALNEILQLTDIRALLQSIDNMPTGGTATEFADQIAREWEVNRRLVQAQHLKHD
ncbi:MAG: tripartite tricarboxylate transporter substrate binding protein [Pseudomonadota bacterium]